MAQGTWIHGRGRGLMVLRTGINRLRLSIPQWSGRHFRFIYLELTTLIRKSAYSHFCCGIECENECLYLDQCLISIKLSILAELEKQ